MLQLSMRSTLQILLLLGFIGGVAFLARATEPVPPTSGLVEPTIRIAAGTNDGSTEVNFRSALIQPSAPRLEDSPLPIAAATVKFFPVEGTANTPSNTWRYRVEVTGLGTAGVTQQRYAKVTYANQTIETFSYMLSNQATTTFSWTISKPPDPWVGPACTSFFVTPKDSAATDVRVMAALVEQSTKQGITSDKLRLCKGRDQCKGDEKIDLLANVPSELVLCTTETFYGNFTGPITLIAREKPDGEAILQKGHFSTFAAKSLGFVVILAGVFIAWLAKVYARTRVERNQALVPAIEMRGQLEALQKKLNSLNQEYAALCVNIRKQITAVLDQLATSALDRQKLIPPRLPNPFSGTLDNTGYKEYLESLNPKIQTLSTLIKDGVELAATAAAAAAAATATGKLPDDKKVNVRTAVQDIDKIASASSLPTPGDALSQVQPILTKLQQQLTRVSPQPEPLTAAHELKTINLEIESISKGIWILYSLLTAAAGLLALILYNPGFGTPSDYVFAFFWGFALPTTVQSLVPGSVATALNISIAKA